MRRQRGTCLARVAGKQYARQPLCPPVLPFYTHLRCYLVIYIVLGLGLGPRHWGLNGPPDPQLVISRSAAAPPPRLRITYLGHLGWLYFYWSIIAILELYVPMCSKRNYGTFDIIIIIILIVDTCLVFVCRAACDDLPV